IKKLPGAGEVWMVYDARDRVAMTQDSNARQKGYWLTTAYDGLNRPDSTGKLVDGNNRTYHQNLANISIRYPGTTGTGYSLYAVTFYDDYSWLPVPVTQSMFATQYVSNP